LQKGISKSHPKKKERLCFNPTGDAQTRAIGGAINLGFCQPQAEIFLAIREMRY
jgi:hypothetical protein